MFFSYCLHMPQLRHLGFPLDSELHPGNTVIYVDPDIGMRSCTKGGGDLNSLEFCVDDFSSADVNPEGISSTVSTSHLAQIPIITNLPSKTKTYERPDRDDAETSENREAAIKVHTEESHQENTQNDCTEVTIQTSLVKAPEDTEILTENLDSLHSASPKHYNVQGVSSSGVLDVNAQEFVPGSVVASEALNVPSKDSASSAPVSLSASAKEFFPSSSYSNPSPLSISLDESENEVEARKCARCDKVWCFLLLIYL